MVRSRISALARDGLESNVRAMIIGADVLEDYIYSVKR
jgi:hypothetical protein